MRSELEVLHRATVGEEAIDELGHMNVRFYLEEALIATHALSERHGLSTEWCHDQGIVLELQEIYTRHYREQLLGARLAVAGGVLAIRPDGIRLYHELVNPSLGERAATFIHDLKLRDRKTRASRPLPEMVAESARAAVVDWPEHGRARTLDLDKAPPVVDLALAQERGLAMRSERFIDRNDCDEDGYFIASRYQDLCWGGQRLQGQYADSWLLDMEDGGKFGWATLESRGVWVERPRVGARIQSFGAEVALAPKTSFRHHWVFDLDRGVLLCVSSVVNLAFDVGARRAIEIPATVRKALEAQFHPDLR